MARSEPAGMNCMSDRTFVDSSVLIYAYDIKAATKNRIAKEVLQELWTAHEGVLSVQVLQEFYVNVTRKIPSPLPKELARRVVNDYTVWCTETTPNEISGAFRIEDESGIGFWDALIISSALKSGARRVLSEDLNAGQRILGILIENPFGITQ